MKAQEVITIVAEIPPESISGNETEIKTYPKLDSLFEKGMYIESFSQTPITHKTYIITFVFRYYNTINSTP